MTAKKKATKPKTLRPGTIIPTPPPTPPVPKYDVERIEDALAEIDSTLSHRLEMIEDNVNYVGQAVVSGLDAIERAIRGEPRLEQ
jgi:malonyl CoA-acyl carrier protein transacylase